ncbi:MAG: ABC transporter permease [Steroidobacteraceae bacterium]
MSGNPIPGKSDRLFAPQIDVWGPPTRQGGGQTGGQGSSYQLPTQLTYRDAIALMRAQRAPREAVTYAVSQDVYPVGGRVFGAAGRATSRDFFEMFEVPFRSGAPWGRDDEDKRENVVVLSAKLADRVFPHADPLGKVINLSQRDYRIVGVVQTWAPLPRFYDLDSGAFNDVEQFYIPFTTADGNRPADHLQWRRELPGCAYRWLGCAPEFRLSVDTVSGRSCPPRRRRGISRPT